jgi:rhodanese-related sulfurtransferase
MKISKKNLKELLFICCFSLIIGLVFNHFSPAGIPLIRIERQLIWESDSSLFAVNKEVKNDSISGQKNDPNMEKENNRKDLNRSDHQKTNDTTLIKTAQPTEKKNETVIKDSVKTGNEVPEKKTPTAILIEQAYKIYNSGIASFVDARIEFDFNQLHIKGAISIPWKKFDEYKSRLDNIPKNRMIVVYCDGRGCDESIEVAEKIIALGYSNVKVFYGGWVEWKEKEYPTEK